MKDTRRWCRGKIGRAHSPMVTYRRPCGWRPYWRHPHGYRPAVYLWYCWHREVCAECRKVLWYTLNTQCPDYHPAPTVAPLHPYATR